MLALSTVGYVMGGGRRTAGMSTGETPKAVSQIIECLPTLHLLSRTYIPCRQTLSDYGTGWQSTGENWLTSTKHVWPWLPQEVLQRIGKEQRKCNAQTQTQNSFVRHIYFPLPSCSTRSGGSWDKETQQQANNDREEDGEAGQ